MIQSPASRLTFSALNRPPSLVAAAFRPVSLLAPSDSIHAYVGLPLGYQARALNDRHLLLEPLNVSQTPERLEVGSR